MSLPIPKRLALTFSILATAFLYNSCGASSKGAHVGFDQTPTADASKPFFSNQPPVHNLVIVMLDESSSFVPYWQPSLDLSAYVASHLKPGDAFGVIGIDDDGDKPENARIPVTILDQGLRSRPETKALVKKVQVLQPRKSKVDRTDIIRSLHMAASFADAPSVQDYKPVLLIFSDMQETREKVLDASIVKGWKFAKQGEAHCYFVNVTDWVNHSKKQYSTTWDGLVGSWTSIFTAAGLDADAKKSFFQSGTAQVDIKRLFPN